jgi:molybdopterin converting factor small subunit
MIAVNHDYVGNGAAISPNAEIALIPPVSGG